MNPIKILWAIITWPFRQVYQIIKFFVLDTIGDFKFIKKFFQHKEGDTPILNPSKVKKFKEEMLSLTPASIIKEYWHWFLLAGFTLCIGYLWGLAVCSLQCNNYVISEFLNNPMVSISIDNLGRNMSNMFSYPGG